MRFLNSFYLFILTIGLFNVQITSAQTFYESGISLPDVADSYFEGSSWADYDNDGDLDVLITGTIGFDNMISKIYKNNGDRTFTEQTGITLPGITGGSVDWGDYNNDGFLDILLTGVVNIRGYAISRIYKNNGGNSFTEQTNIVMTGVVAGAGAWGDYDNDNYLDIVITGVGPSNAYISKIYHNNGDNTFTEQTNIALSGLAYGSVFWGDYDNDGYLDLLLTGTSTGRSDTKIYHNNGDNSFTELKGLPLIDVMESTAVWGDYDNDGDLDILLTGEDLRYTKYSLVYRNNGNGTFTEQDLNITPVKFGNVAWGDYDNDGDLDILLVGFEDGGSFVKLYRNNGDNTFTNQETIAMASYSDPSSVNWGDYDNDGDLDILSVGFNGHSKIYTNNTITASPKTLNGSAQAPANLNATIQGNNIVFKWDKATDTETPQDGLSYNLYLYKEGQNGYGRAPHAFSQTDTKNGFRLIASAGSIRYSTSGYTLKGIPSGDYKWSVQAIDGGLKGGAFAAEQSFHYVNLVKVGIHVAKGQITFTSPDIEYSINSTDGSNGDWTLCSEQTTNVNFGTGGFDVWVREQADPSNKRKVATVAQQLTPSFTINFYEEKTTQIIPDSVEYSVNPDMSAAVSGIGGLIPVTPGQNLYLRYKASATRVVSLTQNLVVPPRPSTIYTIDYINEKTNEVVPRCVQYSNNPEMNTSLSGSEVKISLSPGNNIYYQIYASSSSFKSMDIFTLIVPSRPSPTNYTIDYVNETTNENVPAAHEYSLYTDMGNATSGDGSKAIITPGNRINFRIKATTNSFASSLQTISVKYRPESPRNPIINDKDNTFDWTNSPDFQNVEDYEYSVDNGSIWNVCSSKPLKLKSASIPIGFLQVRVKAIADTRFKSYPLKSSNAFTTKINDLNNAGIKIFPNPVLDHLTIENGQKRIQGTIWSMEGVLLKSFDINPQINRIDLDDFNSGLYILKLQNDEIKIETKFVKQ